MSQHHGLGPILAATITVNDLVKAESRYLSVLGYHLAGKGTVSKELALSWGVRDMSGSAWILLKPESGENGWIRLIEGETPQNYKPLAHFGWTAIEILVSDPEKVHERMQKSPFVVIGEPQPLSSTPEIKALQVLGPDGEVLYLTNVPVGASPVHELPSICSNIDRIFIMVLGTSNFESTHKTYLKNFGLKKTTERTRARNFVGASYGLRDEGELLQMSTIQLGGASLIQVDSMQPSATQRPCIKGKLPPGVAIVSFACRNIDQFLDNALGPVVCEEESIYVGQRALTMRGSSDELIELVEFCDNT